MNNDLNWEHLRYFVAVVRAGSVVGAARNLGVSHATVLRNVSRLEQSLGIRLFDRIQSGYLATAEGEEIFVNAAAMEEQAETLKRRAMGQDPAPEGLLKLVVSDTSLVDLMAILREFRREYPRIQLGIEPARGLAAGILQRKADVALIVTNAPPEELIGRQVARISFACYASTGYLEEKAHPVEAEKCDWITWGMEGSADSLVSWQHRMISRLAPKRNLVLHTVSHDDALSAVRAGVGVSLLKDNFSDELVELPFRTSTESLGIWMLTHPDLRRSGRVKVFMDFVADNFLP